jgi:hypothetical protein
MRFFVGFVFLFGFALVANYFVERAGSVTAFLAHVRPEQLTSSEAIESIARTFAIDTKYEGKIRINPDLTRLSDDAINIYVFRTLKATPFSRYSPCAFMGIKNVIFCDSQAIDQYRSRWQQGKPVAPTSNNVQKTADDVGDDLLTFLRERRRQLILHWLIGHEMGHVISEHQLVSAGSFISGGPSRLNASREMEREADLFVVRRIISSDDAVAWWMEFSGMSYREYAAHLTELERKSFETGGPWEMIKHRIRLKDPGVGHPPLLIRILNMVRTLREDHPYLENTDFFEQMEKSIIITR